MVMEEKNIIERMLLNAELYGYVEDIAETGNLIIIVSLDCPDNVYNKIKRLELLDSEDYCEFWVVRGVYLLSDGRFHGPLTNYYYLESTGIVGINADGDWYVPFDEFFSDFIEKHPQRLANALRDLEEVGECPLDLPEGDFLIINEEDDPHFGEIVAKDRLEYIKTCQYRDHHIIYYWWSEKETFVIKEVSYWQGSADYYASTIEDIPEGISFSELPEDAIESCLNEDERDLYTIWRQSTAERVALLNPYSGEVLVICSSNGICYPENQVIFDPEKRKFVFPDGREQSCPPPVV